MQQSNQESPSSDSSAKLTEGRALATLQAEKDRAAHAAKHFDVGHLTSNLNRRLFRGGVVTLSSQAAKFGLRLTSMAILGRLLKPADFGLLGLVTVITGVVDVLKDAGLGMATVQRDKISQEQVSTLFWINVLLGAAIMTTEACIAPLIAWFYKDPRLIPVTLAVSTVALFAGISVQHQALLRRNMRFGRLAAIEIISMASGICIAVLMARRGFSYWSLVGLNLGTVISTTILSFTLSGWVPGPPTRGSGIRSMVRFGGNLTGANMFNYLTRNADNFVVGAMHGTTALGFYSRAYGLFLMPLQQFLSPISSVIIPALTRTTKDPERFRSILLEKSYFIEFCVVITTGFSFAAAPEIVRILLGPNWGPVAPIVRCLAVGGAVFGTNVAGGWVSTTHGWTHRQLRLAMIAGPTYTLSYFIGGLYGPVGVASAFSITCVLLRYPAFKYLLKDSPITPGDLIRPLLHIGAIAAVAALCAMALTTVLMPLAPWAALLVKGATYSAVIGITLALGWLELPRITRSN